MLRCSIIILSCTLTVFSYGLKPSFDIGFDWQKWTIDEGGMESSETIIGLRVGTSLPYSRIIGLDVDIFTIQDYEDGTITSIGSAGSILTWGGVGLGLIEMIPGAPFTPYFTEHLSLLRFSNGGTITLTNFDIAIGCQYSAVHYIMPFFEGRFSLIRVSESYDGVSISNDVNGLGFNFGLRYCFK